MALSRCQGHLLLCGASREPSSRVGREIESVGEHRETSLDLGVSISLCTEHGRGSSIVSVE